MTATPHSQPAAPTGATGAADSDSNADRRVVIKCAALTKVFKDFWYRPRVRAVDNIDLEVSEGEVFGLLGPNGSGKSTTIKMILGLLHPTSGRLAVLGRRPDDVESKKDIGYLPEDSYLYRFLNARETLDYYGRLFHQPRHTRRARIDMLLEMVGLEAAQNRPVGEYSKGMQRRIGIAQALINDPKLLILDEPTTGMDPIGTRQIKDLLIRLRERGKTILLCSHLLADVEDVCDRVSIMFGGKVVANGTLDELLVDANTTTLQTENLDEETIQQIEKVLAQHGQHIGKVSRPRQTLEAKFLELVNQEQTKGSDTSGAKSGGKIAGFLMDDDRSGHLPEDIEAAELLNQLTTPVAPLDLSNDVASDTEKSESSSTGETNATANVAPPADDADQSVLAALSDPKPTAPAPSDGASNSGDESGADPNVDLSLIDGLVVTSDQRESGAANDTTSAARSTADVEPGTEKSAEIPDSSDVDAASPSPEPEPDSEVVGETPPAPLVSERSGESGLNLADAVKVDDEGFEIIEERSDLKVPDSDSMTSGLDSGLDEEPTEERVSPLSDEKPDPGFMDALQNIDNIGNADNKNRNDDDGENDSDDPQQKKNDA